jgi:putative DNA primase/helicase
MPGIIQFDQPELVSQPVTTWPEEGDETPSVETIDGLPELEETDFLENDAGRAEKFVARWSEEIRFVPDRGIWLAWENDRWTVDKNGALSRRAIELSKEMLAAVMQIPGTNEAANKQRADACRRALRWGNRATIESMIALAQCIPQVHIPADALDRDPWIIGAKNAVIDLRTGAPRAYSLQDFITKSLGTEAILGAQCPRWERFMEEIFPDSEVRRFIHKAVGYTLTGDMSEQVFFFLYGCGSNGKSTFLQVLQKLFGTYGCRAGKGITTANDRGQYPLREAAQIAGMRFVSAGETDERERLNISVLKDITGGERMKGANLYENQFEFLPICKIWFAGNHKPVISDPTTGAWRRVRLIPFVRQFGPQDRDPQLEQKLADELPGILQWAVAGCLLWQAEGLTPPPAISRAVEDYRSEEDTLGDFIEDCTKTEAGAVLPHPELYRAYTSWADENGIRYLLTQKGLAKKLRERGWRDTPTNKSRVSWKGVCLV